MDQKTTKVTRRYDDIYKAVLLSFLPVVSAILLCALSGKTVMDLSLKASEWNDELFYYKQVEGILEYGVPQGYFGYNESRAQSLSLGAWNPLVLLPYIIWGGLFGWNQMSPFFCNIFLCMAGIFFFVRLSKPDVKQCIMLAVLYLSSMFTTRYMLSGMSEITFTFLAILYLGLYMHYDRTEKKWSLILLFCVVFVMSLLRPYYLVFLLLPAYRATRKYRWKAVFAGIGVIAGVAVLYLLINKNFCADYFVDAFSIIWLKNYRITGLIGGIRDTFLVLREAGENFLKLAVHDFKGMEDAVGLVGQFLVILLVFAYQTVSDAVRKKKKEALWDGYFFFSILLVLAAFFLMYNMEGGIRHFNVFITMGVFLLSRVETRFCIKPVLVSLLLLFIFFQVPSDSPHRALPFKNADMEAEYGQWEKCFDENIRFSEEAPGWDNVVLWTLSDVLEEDDPSAHTVTKWQLLYATPAGTGINCCLQSYVLDHFEELQGKYLTVIPGGQVDALCKKSGKEELGRTENLVLYALR